MTADCLKLTSYFGERHRVSGAGRASGAFTADALLDLYGRSQIAASILLRGTEGFGLRQHLRSDRSLTLSEDLPLVAIAVDTRARIEPVIEQTLQLSSPGLVTLERAILVEGTVGPRSLPAGLGDSAKLTVYLGRQERAFRVPAFVAVCDLLYRRGIAGATALLGVDGTSRGTRQRARFFGRNSDVPMMVVAVGAAEQIRQVLPELGGLLHNPLLTLERVTVCKRDGQLLTPPEALPGTDTSGMALWQKLMIYTSEAAQAEGQPIHRAITRRLRAADISGVTTLRGVWGFHGDHRPHGDRVLSAARRVPAVTIVIDSPERMAAAFAIVDELTSERGLVTAETIPAMRSAAAGQHKGGLRLAERRGLGHPRGHRHAPQVP
jgi:PII-like signaling protein